jgi:integrase/recombinase XerD
VVKKGKTPVLDGDEAKRLLVDTAMVAGLRDRALISLLIYSFSRISAALTMNVEDYYPQGKRWWVRLHEKGGKQHEMPCHHLLEAYMDAYMTAAGIGADKSGALFRTLGGRGRKQLSTERMSRQDAKAHDRPSRSRCRDHHAARLPHVSGDRHHRLFAQRRAAGIRPTDGRA